MPVLPSHLNRTVGGTDVVGGLFLEPAWQVEERLGREKSGMHKNIIYYYYVSKASRTCMASRGKGWEEKNREYKNILLPKQ